MTALPHAGCGERETFDRVTTLCDMVAETDLLPAMKMNTTENPQVQNQFSMTMKTLRCCCTVNSTNFIQADCLPGAKKHLSHQSLNAPKKAEKKTGLSDYCFSRAVVQVELWTSLVPLPVRQKQLHFPITRKDVSKVLYETQ